MTTKNAELNTSQGVLRKSLIETEAQLFAEQAFKLSLMEVAQVNSEDHATHIADLDGRFTAEPDANQAIAEDLLSALREMADTVAEAA